MTLTTAELGYIAGVVDSFAVLRVRTVRETELPEVTIQGRRIAALDWLAEVTGVTVVRVDKDYHRHQCAEHCPAAHTRIEAFTRRWQLTGARATVVLHNIEPFMRVQGRDARALVEQGRVIGYKGNVILEMAQLGWQIPELPEQPRARVKLEVAGG